ncbi:hypothetical protein V7124_19380 [Neobacillus niacini]|uniref:hypothetical protein n=1 Tax=Neobacillus niacini TaxID=86668 RepID=UPI002FFE5908
MRIKNLLIHRATLLIPGQQIGTDPYGRPTYGPPSTKSIECRMDRQQVRVSVDEEGRDVITSFVLFIGPDEKIDQNMRIYNVIDEKGNTVVFGTFDIEEIFPAYGRRNLHHYEVNVSRGDVAYTDPIENPVIQTEVVTFAGKDTGDGDETRKIYFGLTEDE